MIPSVLYYEPPSIERLGPTTPVFKPWLTTSQFSNKIDTWISLILRLASVFATSCRRDNSHYDWNYGSTGLAFQQSSFPTNFHGVKAKSITSAGLSGLCCLASVHIVCYTNVRKCTPDWLPLIETFLVNFCNVVQWCRREKRPLVQQNHSWIGRLTCESS